MIPTTDRGLIPEPKVVVAPFITRRGTTGSVHRIGSGSRQRLASLDLSATVSSSIILFVFHTHRPLRQVALSTAWRTTGNVRIVNATTISNSTSVHWPLISEGLSLF